MRADQTDPALAVLAQGRSHATALGIASENNGIVRVDKVSYDSALLEKHPLALQDLARMRPGRKIPVHLDDGVLVILHLSALLATFRVCVGAMGKQSETGRVTCQVGSKAEAEVTAPAGNKLPKSGGVRLGLLPSIIQVYVDEESERFFMLVT